MQHITWDEQADEERTDDGVLVPYPLDGSEATDQRRPSIVDTNERGLHVAGQLGPNEKSC